MDSDFVQLVFAFVAGDLLGLYSLRAILAIYSLLGCGCAVWRDNARCLRLDVRGRVYVGVASIHGPVCCNVRDFVLGNSARNIAANKNFALFSRGQKYWGIVGTFLALEAFFVFLVCARKILGSCSETNSIACSPDVPKSAFRILGFGKQSQLFFAKYSLVTALVKKFQAIIQPISIPRVKIVARRVGKIATFKRAPDSLFEASDAEETGVHSNHARSFPYAVFNHVQFPLTRVAAPAFVRAGGRVDFAIGANPTHWGSRFSSIKRRNNSPMLMPILLASVRSHLIWGSVKITERFSVMGCYKAAFEPLVKGLA